MAMASRPIRRMSARRRRAYSTLIGSAMTASMLKRVVDMMNSAPKSGQLKVNGATGGGLSVQHVSGHHVALAHRFELVEYQLHADSHELDQLRQRRLVGLDRVGGINVGGRDFGQ